MELQSEFNMNTYYLKLTEQEINDLIQYLLVSSGGVFNSLALNIKEQKDKQDAIKVIRLDDNKTFYTGC